jgi:hypothetical protein
METPPKTGFEGKDDIHGCARRTSAMALAGLRTKLWPMFVLQIVLPIMPGLLHIWAAGAFGMHWGIYFLMRIKFRYQLLGLIFASFFDLERLFERHEFRVARKAQR